MNSKKRLLRRFIFDFSTFIVKKQVAWFLSEVITSYTSISCNVLFLPLLQKIKFPNVYCKPCVSTKLILYTWLVVAFSIEWLFFARSKQQQQYMVTSTEHYWFHVVNMDGITVIQHICTRQIWALTVALSHW